MPANTDNEKSEQQLAIQKEQVVANQYPDREDFAQLVSYQGPLPPASEFRKYEDAVPGAGDRIISLTENQSKHRHFIEKFGEVKSLIGLFGALTIVLSGMWFGANLIMHDKSTAGLIALLAPLVAVIGAFGYQQSRKERDER